MKNFKYKEISTYSLCGKELSDAVENYLNSISPDGFRIDYTKGRINIVTWDNGRTIVKTPENLSESPRNGICECNDSMLASDNVHCINCQGIKLSRN